MINIKIICDEAFPVYSIARVDSTLTGASLNIPRDKFLRWQKAFEDFNKVQEEMIEEMHLQGESDNIWCS